MKIKTSEATPIQINWLVAKAEGKKPSIERNLIWTRGKNTPYALFQPSKDWAQGGPIIEREKIVISPDPQHGWRAMPYMDLTEFYGPTPLIAAMRCYVASVLGDTVDIPEELT